MIESEVTPAVRAEVFWSGYRSAIRRSNRVDNPFHPDSSLGCTWLEGFDLASQDLAAHRSETKSFRVVSVMVGAPRALGSEVTLEAARDFARDHCVQLVLREVNGPKVFRVLPDGGYDHV